MGLKRLVERVERRQEVHYCFPPLYDASSWTRKLNAILHCSAPYSPSSRGRGGGRARPILFLTPTTRLLLLQYCTVLYRTEGTIIRNYCVTTKPRILFKRESLRLILSSPPSYHSAVLHKANSWLPLDGILTILSPHNIAVSVMWRDMIQDLVDYSCRDPTSAGLL